MAALAYDVLLVSDLRLPGATGRALAEEIRAQAAGGYRTALLHVRSGLLGQPRPLNPAIQAALDEGLADWVDPETPCTARLAVAHHPGVFAQLPARVPRLVAERKLLVVNHPLLDGAGRPLFDRRACLACLTDLLGEGLHLAPAGPQIRAQLQAAGWDLPLSPADWPPAIDGAALARPPRRPWRTPVVVGRHGILDRAAWPPLGVWPDGTGEVAVRILGARAPLAALLGPLPAGWTFADPARTPPREFLAGLDAYLDLGGGAPQPVRFETLEALASGLPLLLPQALEPVFGEAAVYVGEDGVAPALRGIERPSLRAMLAERAQRLVAERFSRTAHLARVRALIGPPAPVRSLTLGREQRPRRRVLFMSSNGVGMGHLTRLLAIARRCPRSIEPVFLAMSQAAKVVEEFGYLVEFTAHHLYLDQDVGPWNTALRALIREMAAFYDARALLFDGNVPYSGLIDARQDLPEIPFLWCRRGMWLPGAGRVALERARQFDAVLAPADLAEAYDRGETEYHDARSLRVDPILLLERGELLPRAAARAELGLDAERPAVLIQLGSRNNYDYDELFDVAHRHLRERYDVQIAVAEWLIAEGAGPPPPHVVNLRAYPLCRYFHAFDLALSAVGYNSFHELIYHGLPSIFVPNEHPSMDDQLMRALYAERRGLALCVRAGEPFKVRAALDRLMDPDERRAMAARCRALAATSGAAAAAALIEQLVLGIAAAAPPAWAETFARRRQATRRP